MLHAINQNGYALEFTLEVLLAALDSFPDVVKFAHGDLMRDPAVWIAAGMYDEIYETKKATAI